MVFNGYPYKRITKRVQLLTNYYIMQHATLKIPTTITHRRPAMISYNTFIEEAFNNILRTNKMPNDWRKSRMVPIFKGKCDVLECNNYICIKLMSHTMELWERMTEARLREITKIADNQFGFIPGKSTTEPIFALRMLQEKYREKTKSSTWFS